MPEDEKKKTDRKIVGINIGFFCLFSRHIFFFFDQNEIKKGLSVQRSVAQQFSFIGKKIQSVHVKGVLYQEMFTRRINTRMSHPKMSSKI